MYEKWKKFEALIEEVRRLEFKDLREIEDESVVFEAKGVSSAYEFLENYHKLMDLLLKAWQHHFKFLNIAYATYLTFYEFCKKAFPGIDDQSIAKMPSGIDVILFRPNEELKRLAKLAVELGVADIIRKLIKPRK